MEEKGPAYETTYPNPPNEKTTDHAPIDMTNRKDSIAFQEGAELYGDAETAESEPAPSSWSSLLPSFR